LCQMLLFPSHLGPDFLTRIVRTSETMFSLLQVRALSPWALSMPRSIPRTFFESRPGLRNGVSPPPFLIPPIYKTLPVKTRPQARFPPIVFFLTKRFGSSRQRHGMFFPFLFTNLWEGLSLPFFLRSASLMFPMRERILPVLAQGNRLLIVIAYSSPPLFSFSSPHSRG